MAVRIRLARQGAKKKPFYRIVVANSESRRDGSFLEIVGTYNPITNPAEVTLKQERVEHWLGEGAKPTDTVRSLMKDKGIKVPA
ncbi:30S ribosomal protein S16 [Desulforegula conservatrix]|uniref:30S ribosomal protein S16 n=1 Tax=Desulforegula conservatrix TaxID=153026 RepID=UPI0003F61AA0|nr:30S ribosomal protein S16 [Desulforegula conservatrix]